MFSVKFVLFLFAIGLSHASDVNVALNMTATQNNAYQNNTAALAVDGCTNQGENDVLDCCSISRAEAGSFWQVDLGQMTQLSRARIYARIQDDNQISGFTMYALVGADKNLVYNDSGNPIPVDNIYTIPFNPEVNASSIRIERSGFIITICEIQLFKACDDGTYGDNCTSTCGKCASGAPCNKTDGACLTGCEAGWSGDKCDARENVAFNKTATQSSDLNSNRTAGNAVDGCTVATPPDSCCASTAENTTNELTINFGQQSEIGMVKVYGHPDLENELSGFTLYGLSRTVRIQELLYNNSGVAWTSNGDIEILIEPSRVLQELTVKRATDTSRSMTICEIEAFEVCPEKTYGPVCEMSCGNCVNDAVCHGISGRCVEGCAAGWRDDVCKTACSNTTYGENCNSTCGRCLGGDGCDRFNGSCSRGCEAGFDGTTCSMECQNNTYGLGCNETCGNCVNGSQCDAATGNCTTGCAAGYEGAMCTTACTNNTYGEDCSSKCGMCLDDVTCDTVDGSCPRGCAAGFGGPTCSQGCQNNTYGLGCNETCGNCVNGSQCDAVTGNCTTGCAAGYQGAMCNTECVSPNFGQDCGEKCNCKNDDGCTAVEGTCANGCAAGWTGSSCNVECRSGTFGEDCTGRCFCAKQEPCDKTNGTCPAGCDAGFVGEFCQTDLSRSKNSRAGQSSTLIGISGFMWNASLAVDGDFTQADPASSMTCSSTMTNDTSFPWWSTDLGSAGVIENVVVYGPTETPAQLQNFNLYLSNETLNASALASGVPVYNSTGVEYGTGVYNISLDPAEIARYLYIALPTNGQSLTLCEVRVFGECPDGTFGADCNGMCHCAAGVPCNKETGRCPDGGCAPGWITDECDETCSNTTFGDGCNSQCGACFNDDVCDHVTGSCDRGCAPGWLGTNCSTECADGLYGQNCSDECGNCKAGAACNKVDGACPDGCAAGNQGTNCTLGCVDGYYGEDCAQECGSCVNSTICNSTDGECALGCNDGYEGALCTAAQVGGAGDDDDGNLAGILGGIFGALAFIIIVVVAVKCYQTRSSGSKAQMTFTSPYAAAMTESERGSMSSTNSYNDNYGYYNINTKL